MIALWRGECKEGRLCRNDERKGSAFPTENTNTTGGYASECET